MQMHKRTALLIQSDKLTSCNLTHPNLMDYFDYRVYIINVLSNIFSIANTTHTVKLNGQYILFTI